MIPTFCPECGFRTEAFEGTEPHAAILRCTKCTWNKWLSKDDARKVMIRPTPVKSKSDTSQGMLF